MKNLRNLLFLFVLIIVGAATKFPNFKPKLVETEEERFSIFTLAVALSRGVTLQRYKQKKQLIERWDIQERGYV